MIFLILAILFGCVSIYGFYVDRKDADGKKDWYCTFKSALAGTAFGLMGLFILWCFFTDRQTRDIQRTETVTPSTSRNTRVETAPLPDMPPTARVYRQTLTYRPLTLYHAAGDTVYWLKTNDNRGVRYHMLFTDGADTLRVTADSADVQVLEPAPDKEQTIQVHGLWRMKDGRVQADSLSYTVQKDVNLHIIPFRKKL